MNRLILDEINKKLGEVDPIVFYGMVDDSMRETVWNYTVFNRISTSSGANKTSYSDKFAVHIVRENFIPEGLFGQIVDKVCEIDGMRLSGTDATYTYVQKPNTNVVVEMLSIEFVRPRKRVVA